MNAIPNIVSNESQPAGALVRFFESADELARTHQSIETGLAGTIEVDGERWPVKRYIFFGPPGGGDHIRLGIFAGLHGNAQATSFALLRLLKLWAAEPGATRGFVLHLYPVCNPTGFAHHSRFARRGVEITEEFWRNSRQPEIKVIEQELWEQPFHGIVTLDSDPLAQGIYGFASGTTLSTHLLRPVLREMSTQLPIHAEPLTDGFRIHNGIIQGYPAGMLSAPPDTRPRPFEILLKTPQTAPAFRQELALTVGIIRLLNDYRNLISYAANL